MSETPIIVWFRQDLRLKDNPAFYEAVALQKPLIPVFIHDEETAGEWKFGEASLWWLHHSLDKFAQSLKDDYGLELILRKGKPLKILEEIVKETGADHIYWNRLYQSFAIERDKQIKETFSANEKMVVKSYNANLIHEPWTIENKSGGFYKVYTPFSKMCLEKQVPDALDKPKEVVTFDKKLETMTLDEFGFLPKIKWDTAFYDLWEPGEQGAFERLEEFIDSGDINEYSDHRDRPDLDETSRLSPHLHWGEISPKQIWHEVKKYEKSNTLDGTSQKSAFKYLKEVLWREFSYHLLYYLEDMPRKPLNENFNDFPWTTNLDPLEKWKKGQTGYPLVDAAMRQLWQTGWMHNRCRMVVGSFLVKHLRIHWHHGEEWFWDCLVDADLANNSASWQWIAGCGADAAPYFRIFNPILQSKKFDPDGDYIRKYVPELKKLDTKHIHTPWEAPEDVLKKAGVKLGETYPKPIVDHSQAREKALEAYENVKKAS